MAPSCSSRISTPAPSPTMKPSRSLSNGRLAFCGSSLRVDSARIAPKPPMPIGVIAASDPPAIITSAAPRRMISNASPIACADAEHAVQVAELGPFAPKRIETWPAARLMIAEGMKNGEILRGPPSSSALCSRSIVVNPPMPDAMNTPTRGASAAVTSSRASSTAYCDAAIAYWMKMSIFLTSFFSMNASGSKPFTSPAMRVANCDASNLVIGPTPLLPAVNAAQFASVPMPSDDTRPMPVTTTRRVLVMSLLFGLGVRLDVLDRFLHAGDLLRILVGNLEPELLLERHHELDGVEGVGAQVVDERGVRRHFLFVHPELLHDDALHFVGYGHSPLLHVHPAVDGQHVPCNIRRLVGGEKAHGRRDLIDRAEPSERNLRAPVDLRLVGDGARHVGLDHAGRDDVHGDRSRPDLARQRLREPDQPRLRRRVVGLARVPHLRDDGADRNDAAALLLQHRPHRRLREQEGRRQVRRDDRVPVVALHAQQQLIARDAGVADDDVEAAVALHDVAGRRLHRRRVGDVERHRVGRAPRRGQRVGARARVIAAGRRDDQRALRGEPLGNRPSDSARCTGDERHLAGQLEHDYVAREPTAASTAASVSGLPKLTVAASRCILRTRPLSTVQGPTSTYVVSPSDARRATTASQRTVAETCATSASIASRARRFGSASTLATIGTRGVDVASARSSGASRSSAGFISAQWNGALTGT